jgi:hypothetical protein
MTAREFDIRFTFDSVHGRYHMYARVNYWLTCLSAYVLNEHVDGVKLQTLRVVQIGSA